MKSLFQELKEAVIVNRYTYYGLITGDIDSYAYMGEAVGTKWYEWWFNFWERKYVALGYIPLSNHDWQLAGGYGAPYEHLLRQKPYDNSSDND